MNKDMRIMLKISGEQLGSDEYNFDISRAIKVCEVIEALIKNNYQIACVMGGGNIIRGQKLHKKGFTNQVIADQMGMLATVQNGLFLKEVLDQRGNVQGRLFSNIPVESLAERFTYQRAIKYMQRERAVLIAGGVGKPGFTTDTGVVAQAFELHCSAVVKTTKVDGIYNKNPSNHKDAKRYTRLSFNEALANPEIQVMDRAAMAFAADKGIKIAICQPDPDTVLSLLKGDTAKGTIVS
jgi:uridylate kinase